MEEIPAPHVRRLDMSVSMVLRLAREFVDLLVKTECANGDRRGKSDLILDGVLRVEKYLREMNAMIVSQTTQNLRLMVLITSFPGIKHCQYQLATAGSCGNDTAVITSQTIYSTVSVGTHPRQ
jgi:hypothetical protein